MAVNSRERFIATMTGGSPDRIPLVEWGIRESTKAAWAKQGLIVSMEDYIGLEPYGIYVPIHFGHCPSFEERVIEETGEYKTWIDSEGATRIDFATLATPGFVTRKWLRFPVETRHDFLQMTLRYSAETTERYPTRWDVISQALNEATSTVSLTIPFLFWTVRQWMGFEKTCLAFYDEPSLMHEMFEYITQYTIDVLDRGARTVIIDRVFLNEDMAYKGASMISPAMFKSFMQTHYERLARYLRSLGVKVIMVDCDGNPSELVPYWLEAGIDGFSPIEIAAGTDPLKLKALYGNSLAMMGGVDKRALARTRREIEEVVISIVAPLVERGRYIPHVDHATPPDVPLSNFVYYRELVRRLSEGESLFPERWKQ